MREALGLISNTAKHKTKKQANNNYKIKKKKNKIKKTELFIVKS